MFDTNARLITVVGGDERIPKSTVEEVLTFCVEKVNFVRVLKKFCHSS